MYLDLEQAGVRPILESLFKRQRNQAKIEAKILGKQNERKLRSINGVGSKIATIPGDSFHFWGKKLGYDCWNDKGFMDEFLKDNPELRSKSGGTREIFVGSTGK